MWNSPRKETYSPLCLHIKTRYPLGYRSFLCIGGWGYLHSALLNSLGLSAREGDNEYGGLREGNGLVEGQLHRTRMGTSHADG